MPKLPQISGRECVKALEKPDFISSDKREVTYTCAMTTRLLKSQFLTINPLNVEPYSRLFVKRD